MISTRLNSYFTIPLGRDLKAQSHNPHNHLNKLNAKNLNSAVVNELTIRNQQSREKFVHLAIITTPSHPYHMITDTVVVAMNITTY